MHTLETAIAMRIPQPPACEGGGPRRKIEFAAFPNLRIE